MNGLILLTDTPSKVQAAYVNTAWTRHRQKTIEGHMKMPICLK